MKATKLSLKCLCLVAALLGVNSWTAHARNPIIANRGVTDPHIHIFNGRAYLYATHDTAITYTNRFHMENWWCWSSDDLVNWKLESILRPEQTYLRRPFNQCWATDAAFRNGKYYWYFSEFNQRTGVVVGDSPTGPWTSPLEKPLLDSPLTPTDEYDPTVFRDDDGQFYIVFGVRNYHIARLNEDMISLAEQPRELVRLDENGKPILADDKNYLHKYHGNYYLSWGCNYAMSTNLYGPYQFKRTLFRVENFEPGYEKPTWPNGVQQGRHGNFFEWNNQWYFAYCDMSQTGNRRFRDAFISYVHYRANGEIADIKVDGIGVGEYDLKRGRIEAENYFAAINMEKQAIPGGFAVKATKPGGALTFPNIHGLTNCTQIALQFSSVGASGKVEIRERGPDGPLLAECKVRPRGSASAPHTVTARFKRRPVGETLFLKFQTPASVTFDAFNLSP